MLESKAPISDGVPSESVQLPLANVSYVTMAKALGVSVDTLHTWVRAGKIIQPVYFGNRARWTVDQAKRIIAEGTQRAGTYPPTNSPRAAQLGSLPKNVTKSIGTHLGKKADRKPLTPHVRPASKRKGGSQ